MSSLPNEPLTVPSAAPSAWPEVWIGPIRVHDILRGEIIDVLAADSAEPRLHAEGKRMFLLGDEPGVADAYAKKLEAQWPGVVAGTHHGYILRDAAAEAEALLRCVAAPADRSLRDYFLARFTNERFSREMIKVLSDLP